MDDHSRLAGIYLSRHPANQAALNEKDPRIAFINAFLPDDRRANILDAGCGTGEIASYLASRDYENVTGIDLFDDIETYGLFAYRKATLENTDLPDNSFDFVYSMGVLNHIENPVRAINEMGRILKPGGSFIFSAHTRYSLFTAERRLYRALGRMPHLVHAQFPSASDYARLLAENGFHPRITDGYKLFWMPIYLERIFRGTLKWINGRPNPFRLRKAPARFAWYRSLRAAFAYQMVIAATKQQGPRP